MRVEDTHIWIMRAHWEDSVWPVMTFKAKVRLSEEMYRRCESLCVWWSADLIAELYGQSVRVVDRRVVRLKGDSDVLALSWSNAALYWHHGEHTQPTVVLSSCK